MLNRIITTFPPLMDEKWVSRDFHFPPGFRFHPSDEELIVHYLHNKVASRPLPALLIADVDLYKFNPWELPKKALFGEDEWFFFSPRDRKYPNGARPNRAAASGYWKATGIDKPIVVLGGSKNIGVKKSLVFYAGRPPKGTKTDWIMNEYRLPDTPTKPSRLKGSMRLDDWVLCRVRHKGSATKRVRDDQDTDNSDFLRYLQKTAVKTVPERSSNHVGDHIFKDYKVMASLLAGQVIPATDTVSTISFQGSNNLQNPAYDSSPNAATSIAKTPKRLLGEQVRAEESLTKRQHQDISSDGDDLLSMVLSESGMDQYNRLYQDMFDLQASDPIINCHDLNDLAFSDRAFGVEDLLENRC